MKKILALALALAGAAVGVGLPDAATADRHPCRRRDRRGYWRADRLGGLRRQRGRRHCRRPDRRGHRRSGRQRGDGAVAGAARDGAMITTATGLRRFLLNPKGET